MDIKYNIIGINIFGQLFYLSIICTKKKKTKDTLPDVVHTTTQHINKRPRKTNGHTQLSKVMDLLLTYRIL